MDHSYSIARRIWRILYPPAIFIAVQLIVSGAVGVAAGISAIGAGGASGDVLRDAEAIMESALLFLNERALLVLLISNLVCLIPALPIWLRARNHNEPHRNDRPIVICLLAIGLFAAYNIVQMMLFALTDVIKYMPSYNDVAELMAADSLLIRILAIGVAAPVVEEIIFRGVLISRMKWLPVWAAVIIQAVIFGAVQMNLFQGLYAFAAGILLGLVYVKFRSIVAAILGHMAYNLTSVFLDEFATDTAAAAVVAVSIVVLPVCAIVMIKHQKARKLLTEKDILYEPVRAPMDPWAAYTSMDTWKKDDNKSP